MSYFLKLAYFLLFIVFRVRYNIRSSGLDEVMEKRPFPSRGILFLPNHPTIFVDPLIMTGLIYMRCGSIRPVVIDYIYDHFTSHWLMFLLKALRVPNIGKGFKRSEIASVKESNQVVIDGLERGDNFLIYPAGQCKDSNKEVIGGCSAVHEIVGESHEINVALVRIKGLFGSSFSRYWQGRTPAVGPLLLHCSAELLKNFIFLTPKRDVTVEFYPAPKDFPYKGVSRLAFNRYLEEWYNKPDGLTAQEGGLPGDSTMLISLSAWGNSYPKRALVEHVEEEVDLTGVQSDVEEKIFTKIAELSKFDVEELHLEMELSKELGMDSLEVVELMAYLVDEFDVEELHPKKLRRVKSALALALKGAHSRDKNKKYPLEKQALSGSSEYSSSSSTAA